MFDYEFPGDIDLFVKNLFVDVIYLNFLSIVYLNCKIFLPENTKNKYKRFYKEKNSTIIL